MTWDFNLNIDKENTTCYVEFGNITHKVELQSYLMPLQLDKKYKTGNYEKTIKTIKNLIDFGTNYPSKTGDDTTPKNYTLELYNVDISLPIDHEQTFKKYDYTWPAYDEVLAFNVANSKMYFSMGKHGTVDTLL